MPEGSLGVQSTPALDWITMREFVACWWRVRKQPRTSVFQRELAGRSHQRTFVGVAAAAGCSLIPTTASLKAAHGFSTTRAVLTWAAPIALNVLVVTAVVMLASRGH